MSRNYSRTKIATAVLCYVLLICIFTAPAFGADQTGKPAETGLIKSILLSGNHIVDDSRILARLRSRAGRQFDPAVATEDCKRITELKAVESSYYNTKVTDGKIVLTFVVIERNIVRSIEFNGNSKYKNKTLNNKINLTVGDYLDGISAETDRKALEQFYLKKGFAFVKVTVDSQQLPYGRLVYHIDEGPRVRIKSAKFIGNAAIADKSLKKAVKTGRKRWFFLSGRYNEEQIEKDLKKLQNIYYEKGFLDSRITVQKLFSKDKTRAGITFTIKEGPAYTIGQIEIKGNEHFGNDELSGRLKLKQGQTYNEKLAGSDLERLFKSHRQNGFIDVKIDKQLNFIRKDAVKVVFEITEGERFRIGRIDITGNQQTRDSVIRRVLDEYEFKPGRWYDCDTAHGDGSGKLETTVRQMVLAESATINPTGEKPGIRDAHLNITEGQTGMVMLGAGITSDSGMIGQLVLEQRNFDISDTPESFSEFITGKAFRGAGQRLRIALEPGTQVSRYSISFTEPYLMDRPVSLDVTGSSYERERESYDEQRTRGHVSFEKRYKNGLRRSVGFRLENVDVDSLETDAPKEITDVKGDNTLAAVKFGFGRDMTDDRFLPTSGHTYNLSYEQAGGDHTFGTLSATYRRYKTLHEDLAERKTVFAAKLHAAAIIGDAPPFEKFYAGGQGSIRGFDYRGVSTRGKTATGEHDGDPIGSDWVLLANAEVTVPMISDNLAALFFIDSGIIDSGGYRASIGTGIQILLPQWFGPVPMRFEIAAPVMKDGEDKTQVFSFSIGRLF